jgi:hypothetical protein
MEARLAKRLAHALHLSWRWEAPEQAAYPKSMAAANGSGLRLSPLSRLGWK